MGGRIDEADLDPLLGQVERLMDFSRPHHVAIERDAGGDRGRGDADVVETAEFHWVSPQLGPTNALELLRNELVGLGFFLFRADRNSSEHRTGAASSFADSEGSR